MLPYILPESEEDEEEGRWDAAAAAAGAGPMYDADGMELLLLLPLLVPPPMLLDLDRTPSEEDRSFENTEAERSLVSLIALSASSNTGYARFVPLIIALAVAVPRSFPSAPARAVVAVATDAGGGR